MIIELSPLDHVVGGVPHVCASSRKYGYTWIKRVNNKPYIEVAHVYTSGSTCHAVALDYFLDSGYIESKNEKMTDDAHWLRMRVNQHLKMVGIKL